MKSLLAGLLFLAFISNARAVTIGSLTYDESIVGNEIITDSLNNLEWLRWDALADLDYNQTLAAIAANGAYEGWNIAHNSQAQMFTDALLGSNPCTLENFSQCSADPSPINYGSLVGDNYLANPGYDYAFFLSDNNIGEAAGYLEAYTTNTNTTFAKMNEWNSIAGSDQFAANGTAHVSPITWLLYRDQISVPEASSIYLLAFGLFGLFGAARRKG